MDDVNPAGHAADEGRHPDQAVQLQQQQQVIRSLRSRQRSYVRFVNRTQRTVDVIWLDYNGVRQKYKTLIPGEAFKVNTFVTHPWIFRDAETTATLLVNSEEVFYPKPVLQEGQALFGPASPYHVFAYISIPLFSLKDRAAQVVWSCLRNPEEAYKLDIPKVLINTIAKWAV